MNLILYPGKLHGTLRAVPSKSQAHRLLICAAFADRMTTIHCPDTSRDIEATAECLRALGASIRRLPQGYEVYPANKIPEEATLSCRDSGSTLRFLLPVAGALGVRTTFLLEGRLSQRPLSPLWEEMERMGCRLSFPSPDVLTCEGKLRPGQFRISGGISSQFITGLLFAAALIPGRSSITVTGKLESRPYVTMTLEALEAFGCAIENFTVTGGHVLRSPGALSVEGDWSNAAFFLAAQQLGSRLTIENLSDSSSQGDRIAKELLPSLKEHLRISAADSPDLVPVLSIVAACHKGAVFTDTARLRYKESDRMESVVSMIRALGGKAESTQNTLTVHGTGLTGGTVACNNDHRIAMAAAIAATACTEPVILLGAECAEKSYPKFFAEFRRLGGNYEQYLR